MSQQQKQITGSCVFSGLAGLFFFFTIRAFGDTNLAGVLPPPPVATEPNILYAMYGQIFNNPASLMVIGFLCVLCWLMDDLPWVPTKYVLHHSVIIGGGIFWLFTSDKSVPSSFPHPIAVFIVEGCMCGAVAFIIHKWVVAKAIDFFQSKFAIESTNQNTK